MKKTITFAALALLFIYAGCQAQENKKAEEAAVSAAKEWLAMVDDGKFGESWDEAAGIFRGAIPRDQWIKAIQSVKNPLGKTLKRELTSSSSRTTLPGAPDGEYVVIQFTTSFENKASATETITPALDKDGTWRISGYYIK
jgi:protein-disulfide isomerase